MRCAVAGFLLHIAGHPVETTKLRAFTKAFSARARTVRAAAPVQDDSSVLAWTRLSECSDTGNPNRAVSDLRDTGPLPSGIRLT